MCLPFLVRARRIAAPVSAGDPFLDYGVLVLAMIALAILVGIVESVIARLRLPQIPNLLVGACILSAFGVALLVR